MFDEGRLELSLWRRLVGSRRNPDHERCATISAVVGWGETSVEDSALSLSGRGTRRMRPCPGTREISANVVGVSHTSDTGSHLANDRSLNSEPTAPDLNQSCSEWTGCARFASAHLGRKRFVRTLAHAGQQTSTGCRCYRGDPPRLYVPGTLVRTWAPSISRNVVAVAIQPLRCISRVMVDRARFNTMAIASRAASPTSTAPESWRDHTKSRC